MNHSGGPLGHMAVRPVSVDTVFLSEDVLEPDETLRTEPAHVRSEFDDTVQPVPAASGPTQALCGRTSVMGIAVTVRNEQCPATSTVCDAEVKKGSARDGHPEKKSSAHVASAPRATSAVSNTFVRAIPVDGSHYLLSLPYAIESSCSTTVTAAPSTSSHVMVATLFPSASCAVGAEDGDGITHAARMKPTATPRRVVAQLPFTRFSGVVRDYTYPTVRFNEAVLRAAWEEKVGWRATSPLIVSESDDAPQIKETEGVSEAAMRDVCAAIHGPTCGNGDAESGEEASSRRCRQLLWGEETAMEARYQARLRHRFLVSDPDTSHAIWALQVDLPSGKTTVVSPADFFQSSSFSLDARTASASPSFAGHHEASTEAEPHTATRERTSHSTAVVVSVPREEQDPLTSLFSSPLARTEGSPEVPDGAPPAGLQGETVEISAAGAGSSSEPANPAGIVTEAALSSETTETVSRAASPSVHRAPQPTHTGPAGGTPSTREPTTTRTRSTSSSASTAVYAAASHALAQHARVPLMGGARGFVDGHMSIARFNRPTALCWRIDPLAETAAVEDEGVKAQRSEATGTSVSARAPAQTSTSLLDTSLGESHAAVGMSTSSFTAQTRREASSSSSRLPTRVVDGGRWGGGDGYVDRTGASDATLQCCEMLFISDSGNHAIRYANFRHRLVRTVAGLSGVPGYRDGSCTSSLLSEATAMAWCTSGLVFTDGANGVVRLITGITHRSGARAVDAQKSTHTDTKKMMCTTNAMAATAAAGPTSPAVTMTVELSPEAAVGSSTPDGQSHGEINKGQAHGIAADENKTPASSPREGGGQPPESVRTPVRVPMGLPPRSPRTPSPSPSPATKFTAHGQDKKNSNDASDSTSRTRRSIESREEALRRPRVWTVAGAPPIRSTAAQPAASSAPAVTSPTETTTVLHYIDAPLPQRAFFGFPTDIVLWPEDVDVSVARVLIADEAFSAIRVLDRDGVRTLVSPMDYAVNGSSNVDAYQDGCASSANLDASSVPLGLCGAGCVVPLAFVRERSPWLPAHSDMPEPYLHASQMVLLVCSAVRNAISLLCPTEARFLERLALDVHTEVMKEEANRNEETGAADAVRSEEDRRARLLHRVVERIEEEEQKLVEVGFSASGRCTVGELGLPSLRRLVLPLVDDGVDHDTEEVDGGEEDVLDNDSHHTGHRHNLTWVEREALMANGALNAAHHRVREQYLRLRFPFVLTPALVHTDHRTFPHLYCFMSGSRGRLRTERRPSGGAHRADPLRSQPLSHEAQVQSERAARELLATADEVSPMLSAHDLLFRKPTRVTTAGTTKAPTSTAAPQSREPLSFVDDDDSDEEVEEVSPPRGRATVGPGGPGEVWPTLAKAVPTNEDDRLSDVSITSSAHSRDGDHAGDEDEPCAWVDLEQLRHARGAGNVHGAPRDVLASYAETGFAKLTEADRHARTALVAADVRARWAELAAHRGRTSRRRRRHGQPPRRLAKNVGDHNQSVSNVSVLSTASHQRRRHVRAAMKASSTVREVRGRHGQTGGARVRQAAPRGTTAANTPPLAEAKTTAIRAKTAKSGQSRERAVQGGSRVPKSVGGRGADGGEHVKKHRDEKVRNDKDDDDASEPRVQPATAVAAPDATAAAYTRAVASLQDLFRFFSERSVVYRAAPSTTTTEVSASAEKVHGKSVGSEAPSLATAGGNAPRTQQTARIGQPMPMASVSGLLVTPRSGTVGNALVRRREEAARIARQPAPMLTVAAANAATAMRTTATLSAPSLRTPTTIYTLSLSSLWRLLFHLGYLAAPVDLALAGHVCDAHHAPEVHAGSANKPDDHTDRASHSRTGHVDIISQDRLNTPLPPFTHGFGMSQEARAVAQSVPNKKTIASSVHSQHKHGQSSRSPPQGRQSQTQKRQYVSDAVKSSHSNVMLPISTRDWRSLVECLHQRSLDISCVATRENGDGVDFTTFRRLVLFLWLWQKTIDTQAHLQHSLQASTRAFAERRRRSPYVNESEAAAHAQESRSSDVQECSNAEGGEARAAADAVAASHDDTEMARFGWVGRLPLVDALTEAEVVEAYEDVFKRAVQRVPGFVSALNLKAAREQKDVSPSTAKPAVDQAAAGYEPTSANTSVPSMRGIVQAETSDALAGISPIPKARSSSAPPRDGQEANDASGTGRPAQDVTVTTVVRVTYPPAVLAADALLRLISVNERSLRSLFMAYSEKTIVRRSAACTVPHAVRCRIAPTEAGAEGRRRRTGRIDASKRASAPPAPRRSATKTTDEEGEAEQDVLWKIGQLLSPTAESQRAQWRLRTVEVRAVPFIAFRALLHTLDIFPSLMNRVLMEVAYMDALSRPLWQCSSAYLYEHPGPTAATRAAAAAADASASHTGDEAEKEEAHFIDVYTRDHSALTFIAFVEVLVRVGLTVFSQLGEADAAAYPSAASKMAALMEWVNRKVVMGHVAQRMRQITRDGEPRFPHDFPLFKLPHS